MNSHTPHLYTVYKFEFNYFDRLFLVFLEFRSFETVIGPIGRQYSKFIRKIMFNKKLIHKFCLMAFN